METATDSCDIVSMRVIDVPAQNIFRAWSQPETSLASWGPDGFRNTKTRLTWRQCFESAHARDRVAGICIPANEQNLDRLQAELARTE
jgi:uncharacterized protein YndB with AHSA1/START domain